MALGEAYSIAGSVKGLAAARDAFKALPEIARDAMADATFTTVSEIVRAAKQRLLANGSIQTRTLYNAITFSLSLKTGRGRAGIERVTTRVSNSSTSKRTFKIKGRIVSMTNKAGVASQRIMRPSKYGHLVEFGGRGGKLRARPFMLPATESQRLPYLERCKNAGKVMERQMAVIGMRNL
jgi:hypothetical protein